MRTLSIPELGRPLSRLVLRVRTLGTSHQTRSFRLAEVAGLCGGGPLGEDTLDA
jgi:hypothetical protein